MKSVSHKTTLIILSLIVTTALGSSVYFCCCYNKAFNPPPTGKSAPSETIIEPVSEAQNSQDTHGKLQIISAQGETPLKLIISSGALTGTIDKASSISNGYLSYLDWIEFNNKQSALSFDSDDFITLFDNISINYTDGQTASALLKGLLSSSDWGTFNSKQSALAFGDLTAGSNKISVGGTGTGAIIGAGLSIDISEANVIHNNLGGLTNGDSHTQYAFLDGRSGGQTLSGGTDANDDITIQGTTNATKTTSSVNLQPNGGNVGIGTVSPSQLLSVGTLNQLTIDGYGNLTTQGLGTYGNIDTGMHLQVNTDIVWAGGPIPQYGNVDTISTGVANVGATDVEAHYLSAAHRSRIRQDGNLTQVKMYFASKPASLTAFYIEVWRENGSNFDRISQENILSKISGGSTNTVALDLVDVKEGDYIGYGWTASSDPGNFLTSVDSTAAGGSYKTVSVPTGMGYNWSGQIASNSYVPILSYMPAPMMVFLGDSIMAGYGDNQTFNNPSKVTNPKSNIPWYVHQSLGSSYTYQNVAYAGKESTGAVTNFNTDVIGLKPKIIVLEGYVNDLTTKTQAQMIANYTTMLDSATGNGIIPVVMAILPWSNGSNAQMLDRDSRNIALRALVQSYPTAIWVDGGSYVGEYRPTGPSGNLWDISHSYQYLGDGIHFSNEGHRMIAQAITDSIARIKVSGTLEGGGLKINGSTISFGGGSSNNYLEISRTSAYQSNGDSLNIRSGGATSGASDKNGGDLYLSSGLATGSGYSNIYFQTSSAISSGAVKTTTLNAGGSGYSVGDILTIVGGGNNATITVSTIDGSGAVLTYTLSSAGTGYSVADAYATTYAGLGTGFKINVTALTGSADNTASTKMTLLGNGNVGIGTTTPATKLDIVGSANISGSLTTGSSISTSGILSGPYYLITKKSGVATGGFGTASDLIVGGTATDLGIRAETGRNMLFGISTDEKMRLSSTGKVGIGVTSPSATLHLKAGTATANTAPLKFNSGLLLTAEEAGAIEFLNDTLYYTATNGVAGSTKRQAIPGVTTGTAAPTSTPVRVGDIYSDTTNKKIYMSVGTSSSADWVILN